MDSCLESIVLIDILGQQAELNLRFDFGMGFFRDPENREIPGIGI